MAVVERVAKSTQLPPEKFCPPFDPEGNTAHHWYIDTPEGATSPGRCRKCGSEREFRNSQSTNYWENDDKPGQTWRTYRKMALKNHLHIDNDNEL